MPNRKIIGEICQQFEKNDKFYFSEAKTLLDTFYRISCILW